MIKSHISEHGDSLIVEIDMDPQVEAITSTEDLQEALAIILGNTSAVAILQNQLIAAFNDALNMFA